MQQKELDELVAAEEKRLGVGSREFMERHNEIMESIEKLMERSAVNDKANYECKRCYGSAGSFRE